MGPHASVIGQDDDLFIEDLSQHSSAARPTGPGIFCFCRAADAYLTAPAEATSGRLA
ncbi:hypothetical protein ACFYS8_07220 [Kitasatospora sp. NPDC004615]|uniref:hypothetical protein n=1 Tax=unclassified Kitasatospora TaxID=2633591 RepID=UPI0036A4E870